MNVATFITKTDYPEFKQFMLDEFVTKPLDIKATTIEEIAIEVKASQIAIEKLLKGFKKFESMAKMEIDKAKPFR